MGDVHHKDCIEAEKHTPKIHAPSHQKDANDEINVANLPGKLADTQPSYTDRGDPGAWDFTQTNFIRDANWHELDLSAIIPEGIKAISVLFKFLPTTIGKSAEFRKHGNVNPYNVSGVQSNVANVMLYGEFVIPVSTNRKIDYYFSVGDYLYIRLQILGWWL